MKKNYFLPVFIIQLLAVKIAGIFLIPVMGDISILYSLILIPDFFIFRKAFSQIKIKNEKFSLLSSVIISFLLSLIFIIIILFLDEFMNLFSDTAKANNILSYIINFSEYHVYDSSQFTFFSILSYIISVFTTCFISIGMLIENLRKTANLSTFSSLITSVLIVTFFSQFNDLETFFIGILLILINYILYLKKDMITVFIFNIFLSAFYTIIIFIGFSKGIL